MKTWITFLIVSLLAVATRAQVPAPATPEASATPRSATQDEVEAMRRLLRQAMTNAAVLATNVPRAAAPAFTSPAAAPAGAVPLPGQIPGLTPALPPPPSPQPPGAAALPGTPAPIAILPAGAAAPPPAGAFGAAAPAAGPTPGAPTLPGAAPEIAPGAIDPNGIVPSGHLQAQNMPLDQFFNDFYTQYSGRTVLRPNSLAVGQQNAAITLKAQSDMTVREAVFAMDQVLALNGIAMIPVGDKFVTAVPLQFAPAQGGELSKLTPENYTDGQQFVTQLVELKALKPSELMQQLQPLGSGVANGMIPYDDTRILLIRDYAMNVKRILEVIKKVDVLQEPDYILAAIPIKYGRVEEFYQTMNELTGGSGGGGAAPTATGIGQQGNRAGLGASRTGTGSRGSGINNRTGLGGSQYQQQQGGYGGYSGGIRPQQLTTPTAPGAAQSTFNQNLQRLVQNAARGGTPEIQILENARIVPDPRSNQLFIYAHRKDMAMITNIVAKMDVLLAQVLIEAVIFEVSLGDSINLGVSMVQNPRRYGKDFTGAGGINNGQGFFNTVTNLAGGLPSGLSYFGKIGDDLDVTVQAIAENSNINVISRPRIQTSHAIPGSFFLGQTVPYVTGVSDYGSFGGSGISSRSTVQQVSVGFGLDVVPYITPEGYVVMDISQTFNNLGRDVLIDGNPVPIINERTASAVLTVKDGQTIMMGGFITESKSKAKSGVPLLKDIPGLGALFRSRNDRSDRTELIVLMRARVLHTPEEAAIVAEEEKNQLLGIKDVERQMQQNDDKRRKQSARAERRR